MLGKKLIQAAAGAAAAGGGLGIESLFSTWLYTGNGSTQTITNGIDLAGEGGLVWCKSRSDATLHEWVDTVRGVRKRLDSASTGAEVANADLEAFNSDGFRLGFHTGGANSNATTYASWTFRKAPGFFDVVTWTGSGTGTTIVPHSLGSTPGCVIIKITNGSSPWYFQHRSLTNGLDSYLTLNTTDAAVLSGSQVSANSTSLTLGNYYSSASNTYVAYLFAHDAGGFGDSGTESVIKCGSFTTDGSGNATVDLGWEPQWLLYRNPNVGANWDIEDTMRGAAVTTFGALKLLANRNAAEGSASRGMQPTPTGFKIEGGAGINATYIYIAIRRGPMKTPTDATEVFAVSSPASGTYTTTTNFPIDSAIVKSESTVANWVMMSRMTGNSKYLHTNSTNAESSTAGLFNIDSNVTFTQNAVGTNPLNYIFRRAPGFFDVVAYTGTGSARTVAHNLGVAPELMIVKSRSAVGQWGVYSSALGIDYRLFLQLSDAAYSGSSTFWNATLPTSSVFSIGTNGNVNTSTTTYIAYLFATCPGVSKVGSYTGTGNTQQIDCGFTSGARLVIIKRTDSTGSWYVWDTARGITSANDPYLLLDSTAAEVTTTDYIDPYAAGFEISSTAPAAINASGGNFIFLAIA